MTGIPHLPKIELTSNQIIWLKETWRLLLETGNDPSYKTLRLNTLKQTGEDFDPNLIDKRLIQEKSTRIRTSEMKT